MFSTCLNMLQITSTMVMCTFLSAPVMFVSAQMSLLDYNSQMAINFKGVLKDAMFDVSGTSFPFGVSISTAYCKVHSHLCTTPICTFCIISLKGMIVCVLCKS